MRTPTLNGPLAAGRPVSTVADDDSEERLRSGYVSLRVHRPIPGGLRLHVAYGGEGPGMRGCICAWTGPVDDTEIALRALPPLPSEAVPALREALDLIEAATAPWERLDSEDLEAAPQGSTVLTVHLAIPGGLRLHVHYGAHGPGERGCIAAWMGPDDSAEIPRGATPLPAEAVPALRRALDMIEPVRQEWERLAPEDL